MQKYINNAFFALTSWLLAYAANEIKQIRQDLGAIKESTYQLQSSREVQKEINENLQFAWKDFESRLRLQERCTKCGG
jgi:hypothetical protein